MKRNTHPDLFEEYWQERAAQIKKDDEDYQRNLRRVIIFLIIAFLLLLIIPVSIFLYHGHFISAAVYSGIFLLFIAVIKF